MTLIMLSSICYDDNKIFIHENETFHFISHDLWVFCNYSVLFFTIDMKTIFCYKSRYVKNVTKKANGKKTFIYVLLQQFIWTCGT